PRPPRRSPASWSGHSRGPGTRPTPRRGFATGSPRPVRFGPLGRGRPRPGPSCHGHSPATLHRLEHVQLRVPPDLNMLTLGSRPGATATRHPSIGAATDSILGNRAVDGAPSMTIVFRTTPQGRLP